MSRHSAEEAGEHPMQSIDRLVHEPARLAILSVLNGFESADFVFLLNQTGLSRGNLSSHLAKLQSAEYIEITKGFVDKIPRTLAKLTPQGKSALSSYREQMKRFLHEL